MSGDVSCSCSHRMIASLSNVWPSEVKTGRVIISRVMGHTISGGGFTWCVRSCVRARVRVRALERRHFSQWGKC